VKTGVVIGKFYPPHRGHKLLIDTASAASDLTVIICEHPSQKISGALRQAWLQEIHPSVRVVVTPDEWRTEDFITVATTQQQREDAAVRRANKVLICDTDALATTIWHRRYVGHDSPEVNEVGYRSHPDLYLLTMPDFGFVQDGTRDGEHIRMEMHEWFVERLVSRGIPFIRLGGPHEARMSDALAEIERLFGLKPLSTEGKLPALGRGRRSLLVPEPATA
jgi:cytidyltransferase-like protein